MVQGNFLISCILALTEEVNHELFLLTLTLLCFNPNGKYRIENSYIFVSWKLQLNYINGLLQGLRDFFWFESYFF